MPSVYRTFAVHVFYFKILGQICDLAEKLESWDHNTIRGSYGGLGQDASSTNTNAVDKKTEDKLSKATKDSCKITTEVLHGIMTQVHILMIRGSILLKNWPKLHKNE